MKVCSGLCEMSDGLVSAVYCGFCENYVCPVCHCCMSQDEEHLRELEDRDRKLHEIRQLLDTARDEKHECEEQLAAMKRETQSLILQLQQKDTEIERSRNLVRLLLLLVMMVILSCFTVYIIITKLYGSTYLLMLH